MLVQVYSQNLQWLKQAGGAGQDYMTTTSTDYNGDFYAIGTFQFIPSLISASSISFDSITLAPNGDNQIYVVKYSALGNVLWAKSIGGNNIIGTQSAYENAIAISYDSYNQNLFITGKIYGTAFGSTTLSGFGVCFYIKMDLNGNYIWAKQLPYANFSSLAISSSNQGFQILNGYTSDTMNVGNITIVPGGFLAKFNNMGNLVWAIPQTVIGKIKHYNNSIYGIVNLYSNDSLQIDTALFVSTTNHNILLVCLDTLGKLKWYKAASSSDDAWIGDLEIDFSGNTYITGSFSKNLNFGGITITNNNNSDMFLAKFDSLGNLVWLKQGNASNGLGGSEISVAQNGNLLVAGYVTGSAVIDSFLLSTNLNPEAFAISLDPNSGKCLSSLMLGTGKPKHFNFDYLNNIYAAGDFYSTISIGSNMVSSVGYDDIFIAKYSLSTGVKKIKNNNPNSQLLIHANPNTGKCNIRVPDEMMHEKNLVLSIYNSQGKVIQQIPVNTNEEKIKINLEAEAAGIYNAVLSNGNKTYSGKIVFE